MSYQALVCEVNPFRCACHTYGWVRDNYDREYKCPYHSDKEVTGESTSDRYDRMARKAYRIFQKASGFDWKVFQDKMKEMLLEKEIPWEEAYWQVDKVLECAEEIWAIQESEKREAQARREGYSCWLEKSLAYEAHLERWDRMSHCGPLATI